MKSIAVLLICFAVILQAQPKNIVGFVYEKQDNNKNALKGARVYWKTLKKGTITNEFGAFKIQIPDYEDTLVISYVGYILEQISSNSELFKKDKFEVTLKEKLNGKAIEIIGSESSQISFSQPQMMETITSKGLKKAACCNLSESFETNPSVDVSFSDALTGSKQIELLGLTGKYSQILQEKINSNLGLMLPFGIGLIPGPWLQSIQIAKGAGSVANGYESIAGQINLQFKDPNELPPLFINTYLNSVNRYEANFDYSMEVTDGLKTTLFLHASTVAKGVDYNKDGFSDLPEALQFNFQNKWKFESGSYEGEFGIRAMQDYKYNGQMEYLNNRNRNSAWGLNILNRMFEYYGKTGIVFDTEYYSSIGVISNFRNHSISSFFGNKDYYGNENFYNLQVLYDTDYLGEHNKLKLGLDYKHIAYFDRLEQQQDTIGFNYNNNVLGLFTEYTALLLDDKLAIVGGIRYDYSDLFGDLFIPRMNIRYNFDETNSLRVAGGRGAFFSNPISENIGLLATGRSLQIDRRFLTEFAYNYGINYSLANELLDIPFTLTLEYFRTDFQRQLIVNMDNSNVIRMEYSEGESFSNAAQVELKFEPVKKLVLDIAIRLNDVRFLQDGELIQKALISREKGYFNLEYTYDSWDFTIDFTASYNGRGRLFRHHNSGEDTFFSPFWIYNTQLTKTLGTLDVYLGIENIADYKQQNPIINPQSPFSSGFDATQVFAPILGRVTYLGFRYLY
jgi:outer membrane receptor for ferrienterochelin and colicin